MTHESTAYNLAYRFSQCTEAMPGAPALWHAGQTYSYESLGERVRKIAAWLEQQGVDADSRVGILAGRGATACASILGACWAGCAWVPLNPAHPLDRLNSLLQRAALDVLIVDEEGAALLPGLDAPSKVLGPGATIQEIADHPPVPRKADDLAYLMFTSGTTGIPKGVMITHAAIEHFLVVMQDRYQIGPGDRLSQFFELTFDLSVFDLFMGLGFGACLRVLPESQRLAPASFIAEQKLTVWFSVPSALVLMNRFGQLKPGVFPDLRLSLFCGEPLPASPLVNWKAAAPNALVENLYGPTEATLACLLQDCNSEIRETPERGCVAIGKPYPQMRAAIMDLESRTLRTDGTQGELLLAGPQLAAGYWQDRTLTGERFITLDGTRWYRTGDLARCDPDGCFHHLGRTDNQVKIMGHRVELEDIDAQLRDACGCDTAMAVAWPVQHGSAQGIVAFIAGSDLSVAEVREAMKQRVPEYMVPRQVKFVDRLPLSANGKFDRNALVEMLSAQGQRHQST
ncbi:MAG: amino acid adenylation domain-containing protein [Xanthomonadales bacterium]|nr:amino acid adenylation domain-containing protein [Xanthomonadales bacterium]